MDVETTLIKIVGKYFSKNLRKMEKNGTCDVTTAIYAKLERKIENGKLHRCLAWLLNLSRRPVAPRYMLMKFILLNKFDSQARQRCKFSFSSLLLKKLYRCLACLSNLSNMIKPQFRIFRRA